MPFYSLDSNSILKSTKFSLSVVDCWYTSPQESFSMTRNLTIPRPHWLVTQQPRFEPTGFWEMFRSLFCRGHLYRGGITFCYLMIVLPRLFDAPHQPCLCIRVLTSAYPLESSMWTLAEVWVRIEESTVVHLPPDSLLLVSFLALKATFKRFNSGVFTLNLAKSHPLSFC